MISNLLWAVLVLALLAAAFAPLESLGWWSKSGADEASETVAKTISGELDDNVAKTDYDHYVIYLSGIGAIDGDSVPPEEFPLIDGLRERLPNFCIINDVFPYSVSNNGLTAQRPLAWLWSRIEKARLKKPEALSGMLINARNAIQLFVSADRRYGPTYNLGTAQEVIRSLVRHGYELGSGKPVTLIGWSGGGQISIGAAWYIAGAGFPISVVSLGGMLSDDPGLDRVEHLWHLYGTKDGLQAMGSVLFAGRWPKAVFSPWTRAMKAGKITMIPIGPFQHAVKEHYFDLESTGPDGRTYLQVSLDGIVAVLTGEEVKVIPTDEKTK